MLLAAYCLANFLSALSTYGHNKSGSISQQPMPGSVPGLLFAIFGQVSPSCFLPLLVAGFFVFRWWVPLAVVFGSGLLVGVIYEKFLWGKVELCALPILVGPVALLCTIGFFMLAFL
jgi:hypothetical protein